MLRGKDVEVVLEMDWCLIIEDLEGCEMVSANTKLYCCGDVVNPRGDCEVNGCERLALWVVDVEQN